MRKLLLFLFAICVLCLPTVSINAANILENEPCGKNATFTLGEDGILRIRGIGKVILDGSKYQKPFKKANRVVVEEGITSLGEFGLSPAKYATSISLPKSLLDLGCGGLYDMHSLTEINVPDGVMKLDEMTFTYCEKAVNIYLPSKLKKIGDEVFQNCKSLKSLIIPDTVSYIGKNAFKGCKELNTITIPKKLKTYKADLTKKPKLTKVINHSSKTIPLDDCNGAKTWRVNGKKVKSLPPGKTATSKIARYKIIYYYSGGKAQGKCPKYYYYGKAPKLPKVKRKGYIFFGWFEAKNHDHIYEGFPAKQEMDAHMVAVLVKVKIRRIAKNKVKITLKDNIRWGTLAKNKEDLEYGYTYPKYKMQDYSIDIKEKTKTGKDKLVGGCYTRGNKSEVCKINPKKDLFIVISFDWKYESLPDSGDADIDDEMEIRYSGEKKFKIPAYKN